MVPGAQPTFPHPCRHRSLVRRRRAKHPNLAPGHPTRAVACENQHLIDHARRFNRQFQCLAIFCVDISEPSEKRPHAGIVPQPHFMR